MQKVVWKVGPQRLGEDGRRVKAGVASDQVKSPGASVNFCTSFRTPGLLERRNIRSWIPILPPELGIFFHDGLTAQ